MEIIGTPAILEPAKTEWTEAEYLSGFGLDPELRHENVRGRVLAMATPTAAHAEISSNIFVPLHTLLRGKPCFCIPAVTVACDADPKPAG